MKIGYINRAYPEIRNIIDISPNVTYVKLGRYNYYKYRLLLAQKLEEFLGIKSNHKTAYRFKHKSLNLFKKVDMYHFFNTISYSKKPWIVTMETSIPRFEEVMQAHHGDVFQFPEVAKTPHISNAIKVIASDRCKKIVALSQCSVRIQDRLLDQFPEYKSKILSKTEVIYPPQKLFVSSFEEKGIDIHGKLKFLFVGAAFFRKGGYEMLKAFDRIKDKYDFELIIVSKFHIEDYATKETPEEVEEAKNFIKQNTRWITHHYEIPNANVLELMKTSHVGVLPTWADTFGYVNLEFQSCGCPILSTDIRAIPELNPDDCGWKVEVPKNDVGEAKYFSQENRKIMRQTIIDGLESKLIEILDGDREVLRLKGENCLKRIQQIHSPEEYCKKIESIYREAMK